MYGRPELLLNSQLEKHRSLTEVFDNQIQEFVEFLMNIQNVSCYIETMGNRQHHFCSPT